MKLQFSSSFQNYPTKTDQTHPDLINCPVSPPSSWDLILRIDLFLLLIISLQQYTGCWMFYWLIFPSRHHQRWCLFHKSSKGHLKVGGNKWLYTNIRRPSTEPWGTPQLMVSCCYFMIRCWICKLVLLIPFNTWVGCVCNVWAQLVFWCW